ncbi:MAG: hypothetical protein IJV92_04315 [Phascolarctobacterium sp.]|nr:hypothetical protein [Phascolarctobacterium sp.]
MEQRKRPGGVGGLGYYTFFEKTSENGCIYCGSPASTREHVPSKTFLIEPYPENMCVVPACFECNNGYSRDEKYVSCFLDVLKAAIYDGYVCNSNTIIRLSQDDNLKKLLDEQIKVIDEKVYYTIDEKRLCNIILKLAKGHAGFELDYVCLDDCEIKLAYNFAFNMSESDIGVFAEVPEISVVHEVGSRCCNAPLILRNIKTGDESAFLFWHEVQENQYRYQTVYNEDGVISVKIVIYEILYCRIDFCKRK